MNTADTIGTMTRAELRALIRETLVDLIGTNTGLVYRLAEPNPESWQRFLDAFIDQPDAPSPRQLLREDRDR